MLFRSLENTLIKDMKIGDELLSNFIKKEERFFPEIEISSPNNKSISFLRGKGIHIAPVSKSSNLLYLSSYNYHKFIEEDIFELKKLMMENGMKQHWLQIQEM